MALVYRFLPIILILYKDNIAVSFRETGSRNTLPVASQRLLKLRKRNPVLMRTARLQFFSSYSRFISVDSVVKVNRYTIFSQNRRREVQLSIILRTPRLRNQKISMIPRYAIYVIYVVLFGC